MSIAATKRSSSRAWLPRPRVSAAILVRDFQVVRSYRGAYVLDLLYGVVELAVFYFISKAGNFSVADLDGASSYFAFAAVGTILGAVIFAASAGVASRLRDEQLTGTLEAVITNPITSAELSLGLASFPYLFALFRAIVYIAIATPWLDLSLGATSWGGLVVMLACVGIALVSLGILSAAVVLVFKRGEILTTTAIYAMTLLSGSVFPTSVLPRPLQAIGEVLPLRFAFDGVRSALFKGEGWAVDAAVLVGYAVIGVPLSVYLFARASAAAKRAGSLGQY